MRDGGRRITALLSDNNHRRDWRGRGAATAQGRRPCVANGFLPRVILPHW
jgi:hypothetical protein